MTDSGRIEPEPIEIDYEPAEETPPPRRSRPTPMRSSTVRWRHLIAASGVSAALGATVAIIVSNANSNAPTGTLAREIDMLAQQLALLETQAEQSGMDIVSMRSRLDAHADRLRLKDQAETQLRIDVTAMSSQLSAVSGAGDGTAPEGATPNATPLGILLSRINRLERIVSEATAAPETTREVQRAVADLALQVAELNLANQTLVTAFDQREAQLAALQSGVQEIATLGVTAATRAQTIRALSVLDAAARNGSPFAAEHRALAALIPDEGTLAEIAPLARNGAPTLAKLRADFDTNARRAMRHMEEDSDDGWNWLRQSFTGIVSFDEDATVKLTADTIRSARRQLDTGEIREAVTAIAGLTGRAQQDFAEWRIRATERAQLDRAMKALNTRLLGAAAAAQAESASAG